MHISPLLPTVLLVLALMASARPADEGYKVDKPAEEEGYAVGPPPPPPKKCPPAGQKEEVKDGKQYICVKEALVTTCPLDGLDGEWKAKATDKDEMKREIPDGKKDKAGFVWVCTKDNNEENCCYKEKKWTWEKRCCTEGANKDKKEGKQDDKTKGYWHCNRDKPLKLGKKESKPWEWVLYCKDPCKRKAGDPVDEKNPKKGKWKCCCKIYEWAPECGGKNHPQSNEFKGKFPIPDDKDKWECVSDKWVEKKKEEPKEEGYATS
jgi:hypothetical protein